MADAQPPRQQQPQGPPQGMPQGGPSPEQIAQMQAAMAAEAQRRGMTVQEFQAQQRAQIEAEAKAAGMTIEQYINKLKAEAMANHQRQVQAQREAMMKAQAEGRPMPQQDQQGGPPPQQQQQQQVAQAQQVPIQNTGTPDPRAVALAQWLQKQDLKARTCILNGQRKQMFKLKRALRAIESPAYTSASTKPKSALPPVKPDFPPSEVLKLLPLSLLALRVSKIDEHAGHDHAPPPKSKKRVKGLWTVKIEQQQDIHPDLHYVFLYEGPQWKTKVYAAGALALLLAVVMFPLWPQTLRLGVWYLSMGMLGLIGLFFAMAIFRLILFCATVFTVPPGLWLYPNLFEDVGFFDSFRPLWGWQEDKKAVAKAKREARKAKQAAKGQVKAVQQGETSPVGAVANAANAISDAATSGIQAISGENGAAGAVQRNASAMAARVEEVEDE